jgi:hypothetical protein
MAAADGRSERWLTGATAAAAAGLAALAAAAALALEPGGDDGPSRGAIAPRAPAASPLGERSPAGERCGPTRGPFRPGRWPGACWRPYGPRSPFNQPLPARPRLAPRSAAIVHRLLGFGALQHLTIGTAGTPDDFGHPVYFNRRVNPRYTLSCEGRYGRCPLHGRRIRIPPRARPAAGSDAHLAVIDQRTGVEYDLYEVTSKPPRGGLVRFTFGGSTSIRGSGLGAEATAAGFGLLAGTIRAAELERGEIRHALFMTVLCDNGQAVPPADGVGRPCSDIGQPNEDAPAMGTRFQLAMSPGEIERLPLPRFKRAILHAMARYGMFVGDTGGSSWGLQLESGATYTSFGRADPLVTFARRARLPRYEGRHVLKLRNAVDWRRLRVIDPCVSRSRC